MTSRVKDGAPEQQGDLVDDSLLPPVTTEKYLHLYELASLDMLALFTAMSGFLACFSRFDATAAIVFCINLSLLLIVQVSRTFLLRDLALSWAAISYACLTATQTQHNGNTINYFWPLPFLFLLTGFRFIALWGMAAIVFIVHIAFVGGTDAMYFGLDNRALPVLIDLALFFVNVAFGVAIYVLFFFIGQAVWCLNKYPTESLNAMPLLDMYEQSVYSQQPMGLVLRRSSFMSEEQHLLILLKFAQLSPYRDALMELMRPTILELRSIAALGILESQADEQKTVRASSSLGQFYSAAGEALTEKQSKHPEHLEMPQLDATWYSSYVVPGIDEDSDIEFAYLRRFLRAALCQFILDSHPNRLVCEAIQQHKDFRCSREQMEAALVAFNVKSAQRRQDEVPSPRLMVQKTALRLWGSILSNQEEYSPPRCDDLILPCFVRTTHPAIEHEPRPTKKVGRRFTLLVGRKPSRRFAINRLGTMFLPRYMRSDELSSLLSGPQSLQKVSTVVREAVELEEAEAEETETRTEYTEEGRSSVLTLDSSEIEAIQSAQNKVNLVRVAQAVHRLPCWTPSLLIAALGSSDTHFRWVEKDERGFPRINAVQKAEDKARREQTRTEEELERRGCGRFCYAILHCIRGCWAWCNTWRSKLEKYRKGKGQVLQHSFTSLFRFRLSLPRMRESITPSKTVGGRFRDSKIERWYMSWSAYIEAFVIATMRMAFIVLIISSICLSIGQITFHGLVVMGKEFMDTSEIMFFSLSILNCLVQACFSLRVFWQMRPARFKDWTSGHLFKIRFSVLAAVMVFLSVSDYFINFKASIYHVNVMSKQDLVYLITLRSLQEANLHCALIIFPMFCLCTESTMAKAVIVNAVILLVIAPFASYFLETWPIMVLTEDPSGATVGFSQYMPATSVAELDRSEALWLSYRVLLHQFAPSLMLQYVFARAVQGTLRRVFGEQAFFYLLYLDAMSPIEQEEEGEVEYEEEEEEYNQPATGEEVSPARAFQSDQPRVRSSQYLDIDEGDVDRAEKTLETRQTTPKSFEQGQASNNPSTSP